MKREIQKTEDALINDCLSLFDEQFSVDDFNISVRKAESESNEVLASVRKAIQKAFSNEEKTNYVVDMSDDLKAAVKSGEVELVTSRTGEVYAQLRNANGRFGKSLPIREELVEEGISAEALELALQMEVIKDQLKKIIQSIQRIEGRVTEVIQGQRNDRIGLFYSGLSLYLESKGMRDENLRKQVTGHALKAISDANAQMIQDLRMSMEYLVSGKYRNEKDKTEKIAEHLAIIHQCYDVVYRAAFLKATIYQDNGELIPLLTVIDEYGRFIEKMIVPYAGTLGELDKTNKFIEKGTWGTIAQTLDACRELKQKIGKENKYLLSMGGYQYGSR